MVLQWRVVKVWYRDYNGITPWSCEIPYTCNLRNSDNICLSRARTKKSHEPFFRLWNNLSIDVRNSSSLSKFTSNIITIYSSAPLYFSHDISNFNMPHTQLDHEANRLSYDLYRVGLITDQCENAHHFFWECSLYDWHRKTILLTIPRSLASWLVGLKWHFLKLKSRNVSVW